MAVRRNLHWVLKIGDRPKSIHFFREILGMHVLRHEEFDEGCKATCNGPYDSKWSKTMMGYGPEDVQFVLELTYNYGIHSYKLGNDLNGILIESTVAYNNLTSPINDYPFTQVGSTLDVKSPDGYRFLIEQNKPTTPANGRISGVSINVSNIESSINYWRNILDMSAYEQTADKVKLTYATDQATLELINLGKPIDHFTGIGRIAFTCTWDDQVVIRDTVKKLQTGTIITDLTELPTPGKATVRVIILGDVDGYEICFVDDKGYKSLSQFDPKGNKALNDAMAKDKSDEWFAKKGKSKAEA